MAKVHYTPEKVKTIVEVQEHFTIILNREEATKLFILLDRNLDTKECPYLYQVHDILHTIL